MPRHPKVFFFFLVPSRFHVFTCLCGACLPACLAACLLVFYGGKRSAVPFPSALVEVFFLFSIQSGFSFCSRVMESTAAVVHVVVPHHTHSRYRTVVSACTVRSRHVFPFSTTKAAMHPYPFFSLPRITFPIFLVAALTIAYHVIFLYK